MESAPPTKLVLIVCDQGVEPDVLDVMKEHNLAHYTRWTDCQGSGTTGIREGTPVWPGLNTVIMVVMPADQVEPLRADLHEMREHFGITPGLKIIITDAVMV
jgi:hypothetical protein